jgi:hypothetical protein
VEPVDGSALFVSLHAQASQELNKGGVSEAAVLGGQLGDLTLPPSQIRKSSQ